MYPQFLSRNHVFLGIIYKNRVFRFDPFGHEDVSVEIPMRFGHAHLIRCIDGIKEVIVTTEVGLIVNENAKLFDE